MSKSVRTLTIKMFDRDNPEYKFEGEWAGKDIRTLQRTLVRAYRKLQLADRRRLMDANPTIGAVVSEKAKLTTTTGDRT